MRHSQEARKRSSRAGALKGDALTANQPRKTAGFRCLKRRDQHRPGRRPDKSLSCLLLPMGRAWKSGSRVIAKKAQGSDGGRERGDGHLPSASQSNHFPTSFSPQPLFRPTGRATGAWTPADGRSVRNKSTPEMAGLATNSAKQIRRISRKTIPRDPSEEWQVFACPSRGCRLLRSRGGNDGLLREGVPASVP